MLIRLLKKYGKWCTEGGSESGFIGTLKSLIDQQPSIDTYGTWIPCTERLPENSELVLVSTNFSIIAIGVWSDYHNRWICYAGFLLNGETPIAWMPLPESYEGTEEDEGK